MTKSNSSRQIQSIEVNLTDIGGVMAYYVAVRSDTSLSFIGDVGILLLTLVSSIRIVSVENLPSGLMQKK